MGRSHAALRRGRAGCRTREDAALWSPCRPLVCTVIIAPTLHRCSHACFGLEEFESAKEAFEQAAALEPAKRIHKQWVEMCKAQLGEELAPPLPLPHSPPSAPAASAVEARSGAASSSQSGDAKGITLSGDDLKRFLAQEQLKVRAQEAQRARKEQEAADTTAQPKHVTVDDPEFSKYWGTSLSSAIVATLPDKPSGKYRHQWFQVRGCGWGADGVGLGVPLVLGRC